MTRDFRPPKPDPAGILHIAGNWGLHGEDGVPDASGLIMVGDSIDDMTAGRKAGAATVLLLNDVNRHLEHHEHTDLVIDRLDDLVAILGAGFRGEGHGTSPSREAASDLTTECNECRVQSISTLRSFRTVRHESGITQPRQAYWISELGLATSNSNRHISSVESRVRCPVCFHHFDPDACIAFAAI